VAYLSTMRTIPLFAIALAAAGPLVPAGWAQQATTTPPAATTPTVTTVPAAPIDLTIAATGDFLVHASVWRAASANAGGRGYDFAPLFRPIRPFISGADLALCHAETPLTPRAPRGFPVFSTPAALARAIRSTGWDACSTASNHTLDLGQYGVDATIAALRRNGVEHAGSAASAAGARRIPMLRAGDVRVAFLAYTQLSNGQAMPHAWSMKWASARSIIADARRARRQGAQAVVVNVHWGDEYSHSPNDAQRRLADALVASGQVTAIVGQHVHVVQPVQRVRGVPVVFGEGNLVSGQGSFAGMPAATGDGYIALLRIRIASDGTDRLRRVDYVPVEVAQPGSRVVPAAVGGASWRRTVGVVGRGPAHGPWKRSRP